MCQHTSTDSDALLSLLQQVKENYQEPPPAPPKRGKRRDFSALSFLLPAARRHHTAHLHRQRVAPTAGEGCVLAPGFSRTPHRTPIGRRLTGLVPEAEAPIYAQAGGWVLTPKQLPAERRSWKADLYDYRKQTIELLCQRSVQAAGLKQCPVQGAGRNGAFVLASVWLYQICFLANYRAGKPPAHIKDHLDCARWRISSG